GASVVGGSVVGGSATRVTETMNDVLGGTLPPMTLPQLDPGHGVDLRQLIADLEQAYIRAALSACGGTIAGSARLLGLQRTTLIEKMRRLHITPSA
ncbi:helix-turn-helix domain-containing protein, partial [Polymorphobacter multimanifer]